MISPEAMARKQRSIDLLKAEGIPYIDHLPVIESEAESIRRSDEEVARRAIALCFVAAKGEGIEQSMIERMISDYDAASAFTPQEHAFISDPDPNEHDRVQFVWRYECYWVMLWALGFVEALGRPDHICDVGASVVILRDLGREGFMNRAKLRPQAELLDAADLIYRYAWACADARINGREAPAGLEPGVVHERHYALNWLIGYGQQEWDDISTDT